MTRSRFRRVAGFGALLALQWMIALRAAADTSAASGELRAAPAEARLERPEDSLQLVVTQVDGMSPRDVSREARYEVLPAELARVDVDGLVHPLRDGSGEIRISVGASQTRVPLTLIGQATPPPVSFANEIQPILAKGRCNSGGCHGKAEGQNGFKLSLLGFDDDADYEAIVRQGRGRRISLADPAGSLLLRKGAALTPHGGGLKFEPYGPAYRRFQRWIAAGCPRSTPDETQIERLEVDPPQLTLRPQETWQLRVLAVDSQGRRRCVTAEAEYQSNAGHVAAVSPSGLLQATNIPGDAAILVRYLGYVSVCRVVLPRPGVNVARPVEHNFIDQLAWNKLQQLGIEPSGLAPDHVFLRRVYLDVAGILPTAAEARAFLEDPSPNKREQLIDSLLAREEYADYWAMKWANLLRADKIKVTHQGTIGMVRWLRRQFATNRPYDEMVREIVTAQGPIAAESPASLFKALDQPELASRSISQLFLGVRIECAQCHHHPSERWGQDDYAALAGFFSGVSVKRLPDGGEAVVARKGTDLKHPRTGEVVAARALGASNAEFTASIDRRVVLANWMTQPDNPYLARAAANRWWAHYFGRGLVEPIDDIRITNPPTNEPLLDALAAHLREARYDLKAFTRTLLRSRLYQLESVANDSNRDDRQHFSHAAPRAMPAEVLLDAICQTTGVPEKFAGWPLGYRAVQVWDNRMPSYFFRIFGRPVRATVCECERSNEPSIAQALHLINSPEMNDKLRAPSGLARRLADQKLSPDALLDEIFLATLSRFPAADERVNFRSLLVEPGADQGAAVEDILWTLLNSKEFLYIH